VSTTLKARPTTYNGIKMRSRLEAGYAQWLDGWDVEWTYEPQCFAAADGQYLPDFRLDGVVVPIRPGAAVYVEVKPSLASLDMDALWRRMSIIKGSDPDCVLLLQVPGGRGLVAGRSRITDEPVWADATWLFGSFNGEKSKLTLSQPIAPHDLPWPDGYWEGT
jgi:hypothetical protein